MRLPSPFACVLLGLLYLPQFALAHSWVEQLKVIAPNGTLTGAPGFPRGNSPRGVGFNEAQMVHLVNTGHPDVLPTDLMCSQTQNHYEPNPISPRLQASPGQAVALRYQENGHVTMPNNIIGKPENRGTVFIYGTSNPSPGDTLMGIHRQWTADGRGGDGRGRLLATANYDDGQCYQVNGQPISLQRQQQFQHNSGGMQGQNLWCQTDVLLPSDLAAGQPLTLYWVWDWPTMPGIDPGLPQGKQEIYTSCMDVDIVPGAGNAQGVLDAQSYNWVPQDISNAAVPAQMKQFGVANAVSNPAMLPFKGQPVSGGSNAVPGKQPPPSNPAAVSSDKPSTIAPLPSTVTSSANNTGTVSNPGNTAPPAPPSFPQGGSNNGQAGNSNNGGSYGGRPGHDNGSRPPGVGAPGVFAGTPEFGTGSGTAINPVANAQQQPPAASTPPRPTQPPVPGPSLGPVGRTGRVLTVETFVTETVYKTVTAGASPQGQRRNESESTSSPTIVSSVVVAQTTPTSASSSIRCNGKVSTTTGGATTTIEQPADDTVPQTTESSVSQHTTVSDSTDASSETFSTPTSASSTSDLNSTPATMSTQDSSNSGTNTVTAPNASTTTSAPITTTSSGSEDGIKVIPISTANSPDPTTSNSTPQVQPMKRQLPNAATNSANSHLLGISATPVPTTPQSPPTTFVTTTRTQSASTKKPQTKTNTPPCVVPMPPTATTEPSADSQRRPCLRRHGFRLRARAPLYILPEEENC